MKKLLKRNIRKSLIGKIIISVMLVWIPISVVVLTGMNMLSRRIADETMKNQTDKIRYYSAIINTDIDKVLSSMNQLYSNKDVMNFIDRWEGVTDYSSYLLYYNAYSTLKQYRNLSMYIKDFFIYVPGTGEILSADHSLFPEEEDYREMRLACERDGESFFHHDDSLYYLFQGGEQDFAGIRIDLQDIRYTLRNNDSYGSYRFFFIDAGSRELLDDVGRMSREGLAIYDKVREKNAELYDVRVADSRYVVYRIGRPANGFLIMMYMDRTEAYGNIYAMYWIWGIVTFLLLSVPFILYATIWKNVKRPVDKLQEAMQMVEQEVYDYRLEANESVEFNYVFDQYNSMAERIQNLIQEVLAKQVQVEQTRYKQLQLQINPHFLFNSLYMGYRLAEAEDYAAVSDLCMYLGDYFGVLVFVSEDDISLENELKFATVYLKLNQMRFGERLKYSVHMEEGMGEYRVPPLLLQPLIENAITHGFEKCAHCCTVTAEVKLRDGRIDFTVSDDAGVMSLEQIEAIYSCIDEETMPNKFFSLWNIQRRLKAAEKENAGIKMELEPSGRFIVQFSVAAKRQE